MGTVPWMWNGGAAILLRLLPFHLWRWFLDLGAGIAEKRKRILKVGAGFPIKSPSVARPDSLVLEGVVLFFLLIASGQAHSIQFLLESKSCAKN